MADQGSNQKAANTRASMRDHVNTQMDHAKTTADYGGHGVGAPHQMTGSPMPASAPGVTAQKSAVHAPAPPPAPVAAAPSAAPAPPPPPQKTPSGGTVKSMPSNKGPATGFGPAGS